MGQDVTKSVGQVVWYMAFFHFVSQEELIVSKVILLPSTKLIVKVNYLFAILKKNIQKWSWQIISHRGIK